MSITVLAAPIVFVEHVPLFRGKSIVESLFVPNGGANSSVHFYLYKSSQGFIF
jgi:hypothetical protein